MIIRSKAPLRLGLAGGGTDVSPFCDKYGGCVLNATINMYAYCTIIPTNDNKIIFEASDLNQSFEIDSVNYIEIKDELILHKGIYNKIVKNYNNDKPLSFKMITYSEAPAGSGLGSSSTMVVTILKAFQEWLNLPLGDYDLAKLAYEIERNDLNLAGGKQDQYAATFGGINFMEFYDNNLVIVNPIKIKKWIKYELENSILLYYTGTSRDSGKIIAEQTQATKNKKSLDAMQEIKKQTFSMKKAILKPDFNLMADCLHKNWIAKKQTASVISNPKIEEIYDFCINNGALACKISGAGGGGFMMILCPPEKRYSIYSKLKERNDGFVKSIEFTDFGAQAWTINKE
ncbi:MAG: dehydrogenase [Anaeroplasma sp.]